MVIQGQGKLQKREGEKGDAGVGFALTADEHYHLKGKGWTYVSAPVDNHDATTKKIRHGFIKK